MATPGPNPRDSMKSDWRADKSTWTPFHYAYDFLGIHQSDAPNDHRRKIPVHDKSEPVPHVPDWHTHRYVLFHALIPLIIQQLYCHFTGSNFGHLAAFLFYVVSYKAIGIHQFNQLREMGYRYGFLDGDKHERDGVPNHSVIKVFFSLSSTSTFRSVLIIMLAYRKSQTPAQMNWAWLPLEIGLYGIILDFWFYWYHRVMHEVDFLWQYHRTHHLTKHPNPLLTLYADHEQEFFDIVGIPFLTYGTMKLLGFPMGFYEWWICAQYVTFAELSGHSGLRIHATPPSTLTWLLELFGAELVIEDHDLHHRRGWKKSGNYGKQTRLWDKIFGTFLPRTECVSGKIDYENTASIPLFVSVPFLPSSVTFANSNMKANGHAKPSLVTSS